MFTKEFFNGVPRRVRSIDAAYKEHYEEHIYKHHFRMVLTLRNGAVIPAQFRDGNQPDDEVLHLVAYDAPTGQSRIVFIPYEEIVQVDFSEATDQKFGFLAEKVEPE